MDPYFDRSEVSNSDLSWLKNQLFPRDMPDPTRAYRFGSLIDAMITEPFLVNFFTRTMNGYQFPVDEFTLAVEMKKAFLADEFCRDFIEKSEPQKVMSRKLNFDYNGYEFALPVRCKWDIWRGTMGGDIKSTVATTQSQFMDAIKYFDYDRQRAWYMDIAGSKVDVLIGISKVNLRIFKVFIKRDSDLYKEGHDKYLNLAFRWHLMFGENKPSKS